MGHFTRRDFMWTGAAAAGAAAAGYRLGDADAATPARGLILVVVSGGWDTTYALDPKPGLTTVDAPIGQIQDFDGLDILVDDTRPQVGAFFEVYAGVSAVVRGINIRSIVHPDCMRRILTGTPSDANADVGAISGSELGPERPVPYLVLGSSGYPGPLQGITASVGLTGQMRRLLGPEAAYPAADVGGGFAPSENDEAIIRDYVIRRAERARKARGVYGYNADRFADFDRSLASADLLKAARADLGPPGLTLFLTEQLQMAVTALETELSWSVSVTDAQMWDTHSNNAPQAGMHDALFGELLALADDLANRPGKSAGNTMLDETVVAVVSEMGRTPKLNADGGKDHWAVTSSLVFGGGVAGGTVCGGTTDLVDGRAVDLDTGELDAGGELIGAGNFAAGMLELCGLDPGAHLEDQPLRGFIA